VAVQKTGGESRTIQENVTLLDLMSQASLTPRVIILEIGRNLEASRIPLLYRVLVPSVFEVFLHPDDYHQQERTFPLIREDAAHHLTKELERLNKPPRLKLPGQEHVPHQRDGADWVIQFRLDESGEVKRGGLLISSQLRVPAAGSGASTQRTMTSRFDTGIRTEASSAPEPGGSSPPVPASPAATAFAQLLLNGAAHTMDRAEISIGRGGDGRWVDIQLPGNKAISKEHLLIRYHSQRFEAKDVSTNGTRLNGQPMPRNEWTATGATAQFELAKGVALEFRALR
jgi:hypothetical protein